MPGNSPKTGCHDPQGTSLLERAPERFSELPDWLSGLSFEEFRVVWVQAVTWACYQVMDGHEECSMRVLQYVFDAIRARYEPDRERAECAVKPQSHMATVSGAAAQRTGWSKKRKRKTNRTSAGTMA